MSGDDFRMHVVKVKICAPDDAPAGLGKAVTIKAHLKGYPKISAAKILQVDVDHVYRLSTDVSLVDNENSRSIRGLYHSPDNREQQR